MINSLLDKIKSRVLFLNSIAHQINAQAVHPKEYWTEHNVTQHHEFSTMEESLDYFHWRNDQYFNYIQNMPVKGQDGKVVLDYGCGPGHDLVGFGVYSKPQKLVGIDISPSSIKEAEGRLSRHGIKAELLQLDKDSAALPFQNNTFDHIHSSGVLHHTQDPIAILKELNRVLKQDGTMNIMIYNYDSVWVHLYVAYQRAIVQGLYSSESLREQFKHSTDGEQCPISNCYRPSEWVDLCQRAGLKAEFSGAAISMHEMALLSQRFDAIQDRRLPAESRKFLLQLTFDEHGYPKHNGQYAGVDACFRVTKVG